MPTPPIGTPEAGRKTRCTATGEVLRRIMPGDFPTVLMVLTATSIFSYGVSSSFKWFRSSPSAFWQKQINCFFVSKAQRTKEQRYMHSKTFENTKTTWLWVKHTGYLKEKCTHPIVAPIGLYFLTQCHSSSKSKALFPCGAAMGAVVCK